MGLIKSANIPTSVSTFSMKDIEQHARSILLRARQQANQLLAEAQAAADELKQAAIVEGKIEGHREGTASGTEAGKKAGSEQALAQHKQQLTQLINALTAATTDLNKSRKQLEAGAMGEVVKLAVTIARRVTRKFGELDPEVLTANIAEAMKLVISSVNIRIAIHPSQRETLNAALPRLRMQWPTLEHVTLIDDEAVAAGGCRIHAGEGIIDGDLDVQIDRIAGELMPATMDGAR